MKIISKLVMLIVEEMAGPKTGKPNKNNGIQIPKHRTHPLIKIIDKRRSNNLKEYPILNPNRPVVKGKINNSVGSINNNKQTDSIYVNRP